MLWLDHGQPYEPGAGIAVKLSGTAEHPGSLRQCLRQHPATTPPFCDGPVGCPLGCCNPQIKPSGRHPRIEPCEPEQSRQSIQTVPVTTPLFGHVLVVAKSSRPSRLNGTWTSRPACFLTSDRYRTSSGSPA